MKIYRNIDKKNMDVSTRKRKKLNKVKDTKNTNNKEDRSNINESVWKWQKNYMSAISQSHTSNTDYRDINKKREIERTVNN